MPARIGRLSADEERRHPVTIRKASLMVGLIMRVSALRNQTGAQYSAVEYTGARVAVRRVVAPAPQPGVGLLLLLQHPQSSFVFGRRADRTCFFLL